MTKGPSAYLFRCMLALGVLAGACVDGPDDDDSADDDDVDGCVVADSGGSGGAVGASWETVNAWSTDDGPNLPDYEVLVYAPAGLPPGAPLALLTSNPVPPDRTQIEQILFEFIGSGLDVWAEEHGFIVAFPVAGVVENSQLAFRTGLDEEFLGAAIDAVAARFSIDRNSVHLFGRSGGGAQAIRLANAHSPRIASIMSLAGPQPFQTWPSWERPVGGLFVHDEADPVVSRAAVQDTVDMFLDAGAAVETFFDYTGGHDWDAASIEPRMAEYFARTCIE